MRKAIKISRYSIIQWVNNPRIIALYIAIAIYFHGIIYPLSDIANILEYRVNLLIYPHLFTNNITNIMYYVGVVVMFADAPFGDNNQIYLLMRSGKREWIVGKLIYIVKACLIYNIFIMSTVFITLFKVGTFMPEEWGKVIYTITSTDIARQVDLQFAVSESLINAYSPIIAFIYNMILQCLASILLGVLIFAFALLLDKRIALIVGVALIGLDLLIYNVLPVSYYRFSPISLGKLVLIDPKGLTNYPSLAYAICGLMGVSILICIYMIYQSKKISFTSIVNI